MGDSVSKYDIGITTLNLYDVVAFFVKDKTLVVYTVGGTLYFNEPVDIPNVTSTHSDLSSKFSALGGSSGSGSTPTDDSDDDTGGSTTPPVVNPPSSGNGTTPPTTSPPDSGGDDGSDGDDGSTPPGEDDPGTNVPPSGDGDGELPDGSGHQIPNPDFDTTGMIWNAEYGVWHDPVTDNAYWPDGTLADAGSGTDDDEEG